MEELFTGKVIKVGSSLAVIIPKNICDALEFERGNHVAFAIYLYGNLCIRKLTDAQILQIKPPLIPHEK